MGLWNFRAEGSEKEYKMAVPGCWEAHPDFLSYRGKATYTKKLYINESCNLRLEFKGVSHTADVYFDGIHTVHHYNAYTPFSCVVKSVSPGEHTLSVKVDNSFSEASALHIPNDYYTYGGIVRPALLEQIGDLYIKYIHFTPVCENGAWGGKIEAKVENISSYPLPCKLQIKAAGKCAQSEEVIVMPNSYAIIKMNMQFENVNVWDCESPNMYTLTGILFNKGHEIDDMIERIAFREVKVCGKHICLNGSRLWIQGFNRHEEYADIGCSVPFAVMEKDIDMMKDMGANAVRTCHYPNDELFLDLCDERGMLVWEENHARGLSLKDMQNPNFERQCKDCIDEMIENHYNHPSIIIWGILNECSSDTNEGREMYKKQFEQIKSLDTSRPTTFATCKHFSDISLDLPDVVSCNLYFGWYDNISCEKGFKKEIEWLKNIGADNKPMIISEFGAAALYGCHDPSHPKWSEERQVDILEESLKIYYKNEHLSGIFIWQFADCRVSEEKWFYSRARCHNNKGVVDEYRRPKMSYETVKRFFTKDI